MPLAQGIAQLSGLEELVLFPHAVQQGCLDALLALTRLSKLVVSMRTSQPEHGRQSPPRLAGGRGTLQGCLEQACSAARLSHVSEYSAP